MLFNSYEFIFLFLPITLMGYFLIGGKTVRGANIWLLFASFFFYGWWDIRFVPLLMASIIFNYLIALAITAYVRKKLFLLIGIGINIALLMFFKYTDFFVLSANRIFRAQWNLLNLILPLGISFWTFTQTAFLIDTYRGQSERISFWDYALFVMIFPHLIAGPIIDHKQMIPQFTDKAAHRINYKNFSQGITLFVLGLCKKVVIADMLSPYVADAFNRIASLSPLEAWIGVTMYTFQLYFDFSAYSEMAIGLGKMCNIDFPTNFDSPYQATSIIDFWRRWHITLGAWIRNYLYIPLGGNRHGQRRKLFNLFLCMTLCGFWHGAGFRFIAWGMLHGILLVVNHCWRGFAKEHTLIIPKCISWLFTFVGVSVGWALFRANSLREGMAMIKTMFSLKSFALPAGGKIENMFAFLHYFSIPFVNFAAYPYATLLLLTVLVLCVPSAQKVVAEQYKPNGKWLCVTSAALFYSLYVMAGGQNLTEFLYFQF